MNEILSIGLLIFTGYLLGKLATRIKLPAISGYILAGILLNPDLSGIMSGELVTHTDPLLTAALSFITFSIGGSLSSKKIRKTGKTILILTLFESVCAFLFVFILIFVSLNYFLTLFDKTAINLAVSLILASLAAPTDPSATLAVIHEYKAKGKVTDAMLGIAAFDDIAGVVIYTLSTAFAVVILGTDGAGFIQVPFELLQDIGGAVLLGTLFGLLFTLLVKWFKNQAEGTLIVITFGLVLLTYGTAEYFEMEALLSTMALGVIVINNNPLADRIFLLIERYTDELIFVIFFSLSGLHLKLSALGGSGLLVGIYILARSVGKYTGVRTGALFVPVDPNIKKYSAGGLMPQGGIVIGLALLLARRPGFEPMSDTIVGIVIGAALIHELTGPILSGYSLRRAGELSQT